MQSILIYLASFIGITLASVSFLTARTRKSSRLERRISDFIPTRPRSTDVQQTVLPEEVPGFRERMVAPMIDWLRSNMIKVMSEATSSHLEQRIAAAGSPLQLKSADVRMLQWLLGILLSAAVLFMYVLLGGLQAISWILAAFSGVFGAYYPLFYLKAKAKQRTLKIERLMPDFFDLMTISIEAGLGLDAALLKVCREVPGPLADEMKRALEDMKLGRSRREAFANARDRVASDLFRGLMNALIQADQMGIGMTQVLRAQTTRIREQQRQRAKEQAMKAPIKMMFPMILFIFPALFVVLLGPIVVQFITTWM